MCFFFKLFKTILIFIQLQEDQSKIIWVDAAQKVENSQRDQLILLSLLMQLVSLVNVSDIWKAAIVVVSPDTVS